MPWKAEAARRKTRRARTPKLRRMWAKVANSALARGASEGSAIAQASGVVKRHGKRGRKGQAMITGRLDMAGRRRKRGKKR